MFRKYFVLILSFFFLEGAFTQSFVNPSLEMWGSIDTCEVNTAPDGWVNYSNGGLGTDKVDFLLCPTILPSSAKDGNIYARMYAGSNSSGEGMFQIISGFTIGNTYSISFGYSGTSYTGITSGQIQIHLFIDDVDVSQTLIFNSNDSLWSTYNYNFLATQDTHKVGVRLYKLSGNGSGGIDDFKLLIQNPNEIKELTTNHRKMEIYPNPNQGSFTIHLNEIKTGEYIEVSISSISGKLIKKEKVMSNNSNFTLTEELDNGIYIISVKGANGYWYSPEKITVIK